MPAGLLPKYLRVSSTGVSALEALMRHPGGWIGAGPCVNHRAAAGAGRGPEHGGRRPHIIRCRRVSWVAVRRPHRGHVCGNPHRHRYVARAAGVVHHGWKPSKLGHEIPVKAHTSEMTTEECSTFIEWLPIWA